MYDIKRFDIVLGILRLNSLLSQDIDLLLCSIDNVDPDQAS